MLKYVVGQRVLCAFGDRRREEIGELPSTWLEKKAACIGQQERRRDRRGSGTCLEKYAVEAETGGAERVTDKR